MTGMAGKNTLSCATTDYSVSFETERNHLASPGVTRYHPFATRPRPAHRTMANKKAEAEAPQHKKCDCHVKDVAECVRLASIIKPYYNCVEPHGCGSRDQRDCLPPLQDIAEIESESWLADLTWLDSLDDFSNLKQHEVVCSFSTASRRQHTSATPPPSPRPDWQSPRDCTAQNCCPRDDDAWSMPQPPPLAHTHRATPALSPARPILPTLSHLDNGDAEFRFLHLIHKAFSQTTNPTASSQSDYPKYIVTGATAVHPRQTRFYESHATTESFCQFQCL